METNNNRNFRPSDDIPEGNNELIKKSASNDTGSNAGTPIDEFIDAEPNRLSKDATTDAKNNGAGETTNAATRRNDFAQGDSNDTPEESR